MSISILLEVVAPSPQSKMAAYIRRTSDNNFLSDLSTWVPTQDSTTIINLGAETKDLWNAAVSVGSSVFADGNYLAYYYDTTTSDIVSIGQFMVVFGVVKPIFNLDDMALRFMNCAVGTSTVRNVLASLIDIQTKVDLIAANIVVPPSGTASFANASLFA
jgi:hypothetical protein